MPQNMFRNEILRLKEEYKYMLQHVERFNKTMAPAIEDAEVEHLTNTLKILTKTCCSLIDEIDKKNFEDLEKLKNK